MPNLAVKVSDSSPFTPRNPFRVDRPDRWSKTHKQPFFSLISPRFPERIMSLIHAPAKIFPVFAAFGCHPDIWSDKIAINGEIKELRNEPFGINRPLGRNVISLAHRTQCRIFKPIEKSHKQTSYTHYQHRPLGNDSKHTVLFGRRRCILLCSM